MRGTFPAYVFCNVKVHMLYEHKEQKRYIRKSTSSTK